MIGLLVFKEKLKQFYGKYNIYIVPVVKFLVGFLTFWLINANVGFMSKLKNPLIPVDGLVTSQLLINIFEHNTPLHDGAIIIRGNRVTSATCYLPLSDNLSISKDLGTRHRAALGISESTDSLTVVVSEETGRVSLAAGGSLRRINSPEELKLAIAAKPEEETVSGPFKLLKGWHKNERKAE